MHKQQNYQIPFLRQVGSIGFVPRTKVRFLKCIQPAAGRGKGTGEIGEHHAGASLSCGAYADALTFEHSAGCNLQPAVCQRLGL